MKEWNMAYFKFFLFALVMSSCWVEARKEDNLQDGDYSRYVLISVIPNNDADKEYLMNLARKKIILVWNEVQMVIGNKNLIRVNRCRLKHLMKDFKKRNMKVYVVAANLQRLMKRNSVTFLTNKDKNATNFDPKDIDFSQYHTFEEIELFLKDLTEKHKDISTLEIVGKSFEKRSLYAVKISLNGGERFLKNRGSMKRKFAKEFSRRKLILRYRRSSSMQERKEKQIILIDCGIHGREWTSISFCLYFINALITGYKKNEKDFKTVLEKYDFIIIPVMNPDGYIYSQEEDRSWRKTRSKIPGSSCVGADGNRNFYSPRECDDENPCSAEYCGHKPFSEPEVAALKALLEKTNGKLKAFFDIHAYGQYWIMPWVKYKKKPEHYDEMMKVAKIGTEALEKRFNTKYDLGMGSRLMYQTTGSTIDYVYEKGFAKYSFVLELRDKGDCTLDFESCGFSLPPDKLLATCQETADGVTAAILAMK